MAVDLDTAKTQFEICPRCGRKKTPKMEGGRVAEGRIQA